TRRRRLARRARAARDELQHDAGRARRIAAGAAPARRRCVARAAHAAHEPTYERRVARARDASGGGATQGVRRRLGAAGGVAGAEVTVRDRGPGIAPADLPHVFDRFYRSPSARGTPGSGLGLAIVRQVAESHGGTVTAEAAEGGGTVVRLVLSRNGNRDS